jgi:hypothetical protein
MYGMIAVSIAIDPANADVEAASLELLRKPEQGLSLLARHGSLARTTWPDRPAFVAQRALLAERTANRSSRRLRELVEKPKRRR